MRPVTFIALVLLVGLAAVGYYRGWFHLSTTDADQKPSATIVLDKDKFREDERKARDKMQEFRRETKEKIGEATGRSGEPVRQP